ncbi:protein FAM228A [Talpa occidentalis]|uniref:protein FAM228A-like n=1 Tax=Talpa occidentalis TaxID=50954 RepID=UPI0023F7B293|nr:protein FAM228A-like [Talpa occidentalis]XP_054557286.1 protein FAM228A [Talpa occidentalis]
MAASRTPRCEGRVKAEKWREWPEPAEVDLMEELAREDIDEAVHTILFRENYVVKKLDTYFQHLDIFKERRKEMLHKKWTENVAEPLQQKIMEKVISYRRMEKRKQENVEYFLKHSKKMVTVLPFCDPLFKRQQEMDKEKRAALQYETGKHYTLKEFQEMEKARLDARLPQFTFTLQSVSPKEWHKAPERLARQKPHSNKHCPEKICTEKKHAPNKEKQITDLSQSAFERQFYSSKLNKGNKRNKKKVLVLGQQRPRSWTAGEGGFRRGLPPTERRVMTAEVLGQHLASLQLGAKQDRRRPASSSEATAGKHDSLDLVPASLQQLRNLPPVFSLQK